MLETKILPLSANFRFSGIPLLLRLLSLRKMAVFFDFLSLRSGTTSLQHSIIFSNKKT